MPTFSSRFLKQGNTMADHTSTLARQTAPGTIPFFDRSIGSWRISVERKPFENGELRHLYDRASPRWDKSLDRMGVPDAYDSILGTALNANVQADLPSTPKVLDCGVGTGALSSALIRTLRRPLDLYGVDLSPGMLGRAKALLAGTAVHLTLRQADIRALPYADDMFDVVMAAHVLEHLFDPLSALSEMMRVLKPGGILLMCLTRSSGLGAWIRVRWRTHGVTPTAAQNLLAQAGLNSIRCVSQQTNYLAKQLTVACVGVKPGCGNVR